MDGGTEAQWLGTGPTVLGSLGGHDVYEMLIPTGGDFINASVGGALPISGDALGDGQAAYLIGTPEPGTLAVLGVGLLGLGLVRRRRNVA